MTQNFKRRVYLGEPANLVRMFNENLADEMSITWIGRCLEKRLMTLKLISSQASMPLTYSGSILGVTDALDTIRLGFERISLTRAFLHDPTTAADISGEIGRSSTTLKIPIVDKGDGELVLFDWIEAKPMSQTLRDFLLRLDETLVSEVIAVSVASNGSNNGPDWRIADMLAEHVGVLRGYEGGVRSESDISGLWSRGVDAVYSASYLSTFGKFNAPLVFYPEVEPERYLP